MSTKTRNKHRKKPPPKASRPRRTRPPEKKRSGRRPARELPWGAILAVAAVVGIGAMLILGDRSGEPENAPVSGTLAPAFTLPSSSGGEVSLSDFRGRDVLLYFNEGVGCDACFYQTVELERRADRLEAVGLELVAVVVNPLPDVQRELGRFGITTPYLIDADKEVSEAYGTLGTGMHADLPGHGFVLVDAEGKIRWQKEYPSMFVSAEDLLGELKPHLPA